MSQTLMAVDPADITRYRELLAMQEAITSELNGLKNKWKQLTPGKYGDVTVSQPRRFSPERALDWITQNAPTLLPQVQETVLSQAKVKATLPPAVYDQACCAAGSLTVRVK